MNCQQTLLFEDDPARARPAKFHIVIICESVADKRRAKRFSDRVAAEVSDGHVINLNVWSFHGLKTPEMLFLAASAAAVSDMIIVAATGAKTLPVQMKHWIAMWSCLLNGRRRLVAGLFASSVEESAPIRAELRKAALRKGLPFYTRSGHGAPGMRRRENFRTERPSCLLGETRSTAGNARGAVVTRTQEQITLQKAARSVPRPPIGARGGCCRKEAGEPVTECRI